MHAWVVGCIIVAWQCQAFALLHCMTRHWLTFCFCTGARDIGVERWNRPTVDSTRGLSNAADGWPHRLRELRLRAPWEIRHQWFE